MVVKAFSVLLLHMCSGSFLTWLMLLVFTHSMMFRVRSPKLAGWLDVFIAGCTCHVELDEMIPEFAVVLGDEFLPEDLGRYYFEEK